MIPSAVVRLIRIEERILTIVLAEKIGEDTVLVLKSTVCGDQEKTGRVTVSTPMYFHNSANDSHRLTGVSATVASDREA